MEKKEKKAETLGAKKPSKTAVLTSVRTLRKNLKELEWDWPEGCDLEKLEENIKNKIIAEL